MNENILTLEQLQAKAAALRAGGKRIVATNGCFDILHVGHVRYLTQARAFGDVLVVGVNGDDSVRELKGPGRPVNDEGSRAQIIAALRMVDYVMIFPEKRATNFLKATQPAIYVKGGDYTNENLDAEERELLQKIGTRIEIVPFVAGFSTSDLLTRIGENAS